MPKVTASVKSVGSKYGRVRRKYESNVKSAIRRSGNLVRTTAVDSILQGAKSGVVYELYNPRRTHRSSAAGEPPASDTGRLVSNIFTTFEDNGFTSNIESRVDYSAYLEFGTSKMAARPFLQPALEENKQKIRKLIRDAVRAR